MFKRLLTHRTRIFFFTFSFLSFFYAFLTPIVSAQSPKIFIVPPQGEIVAGQETRFTLFIHNPEDNTVHTREYTRLMVDLTTPNNFHVVEAVPVDTNQDDTITIPANGYAKQEYTFLLPEQMSGNVSLSIKAYSAGPILFSADPMPLDQRTEQVAIGEKESVFQPFLDNLSAYEPMYFLFGVDPGTDKSKFQISFKYKLFNKPFDAQMVNSFIDGFHFAYTQTSYWDLKSDSKPFDDTSYKPELFYLIPKIDLNNEWIKAFGIQMGFQHESNGKDDDVSRSTNFAYIQPIMAFALTDEHYLAVAPRIWAYVANDNDTNPDLYKYRGYFDLHIKMGNPNGFVLDTHTRWAEEGPSFQTDLSYPLAAFFRNRLNLYLHLQYFNGYAEQLAQYQEKEEILRLGFSITR